MPRNKYGVAPKADRTYNGVVYASKAEMLRAQELDLLIKSGSINWWLGQPKFRLGCPENVYVADFLVVPFADDGDVWVEDTKGVQTEKFRRDKKLWAAYGPCELHILKRRSNGWVADIIEGGES